MPQMTLTPNKKLLYDLYNKTLTTQSNIMIDSIFKEALISFEISESIHLTTAVLNVEIYSIQKFSTGTADYCFARTIPEIINSGMILDPQNIIKSEKCFLGSVSSDAGISYTLCQIDVIDVLTQNNKVLYPEVITFCISGRVNNLVLVNTKNETNSDYTTGNIDLNSDAGVEVRAVTLDINYNLIPEKTIGEIINGSDFSFSENQIINHTDFPNRLAGQIIKATDF